DRPRHQLRVAVGVAEDPRRPDRALRHRRVGALEADHVGPALQQGRGGREPHHAGPDHGHPQARHRYRYSPSLRSSGPVVGNGANRKRRPPALEVNASVSASPRPCFSRVTTPLALIASSRASSRASAVAAPSGGNAVWARVRCNAVTFQPSRNPLPTEVVSTTSSSQCDGVSPTPAVEWASMPMTWSARTSPSEWVCTHTFDRPTALTSLAPEADVRDESGRS